VFPGLLLVAWLAPAAAPGAEPALSWGDVLPAPEVTGLSEEGRAMLRAVVEGGVDAELRWSDFRDLRGDLRGLYAERGWTLAWSRSGRPTDQAWQEAALLMAADRKGLDPRDYGGDWDRRLSAVERAGASEAERVRVDVALTVSALRFVGDLALGRIRPVAGTELLGRLQLARRAGPPPDLGAIVATAASAVDPEGVIASVEPDGSAYARTLAALEEQLALQALPTPPALPPLPDGHAVAPERYPEPARLAERLRQLGERVDDPGPAEDGSSEGRAACASPLAEAVARFQGRHGLDASGFVDEPTLRALSEPPSRRVAQLGLALERWRWFARRGAAESILVNVPEFALRAGDGARPLTMRVVVGQAYEWGTPVFASELTTVVFRPAWTVPLPIQQEELLPLVEADRRFLAAADFEVLDTAERVVPPLPTPELLSGLRSGALRLRQRPGPGSALGLVEFILSNSAWIYLHGTPATDLFARSRRDFSHGCIRVEDPLALAEWVLRDEPGWSPRAIRGATQGARTLEVNLRRPVPVRIGYFTATVGEDGAVKFLEDVYGQDSALTQALAGESRRRGGS
jgi:murein L,D-transpeptidase YcbB/YkuD